MAVELNPGDVTLQGTFNLIGFKDGQRVTLGYKPPKGRKFAVLLLGDVDGAAREVDVEAMLSDLGFVPAERASQGAAAGVPEGFFLVRKEAIDWLNGESDFECPPDRYLRGEPPRYWWRSVFREKAGLAAPSAPMQGAEREVE